MAAQITRLVVNLHGHPNGTTLSGGGAYQLLAVSPRHDKLDAVFVHVRGIDFVDGTTEGGNIQEGGHINNGGTMTLDGVALRLASLRENPVSGLPSDGALLHLTLTRPPGHVAPDTQQKPVPHR